MNAQEKIHVSKKSFILKNIFKPSIPKLFFPVLVLILISFSYYVNSIYIPPFAEASCSDLSNREQLIQLGEERWQKSRENNADPKEIISLLQQENDLERANDKAIYKLLTQMEPLIIGNFYLTFSQVYKLNPFFPVPCEVSLMLSGSKNNPYCRYYMDKTNYDCINDISMKQEKDSFGRMSEHIIVKLPPYNKLSLLSLTLNTILLLALVYLISCFILYTNERLIEEPNKTKIIINGIVLTFPIITYILFGFVCALVLSPFIICFIVLSFIKKESTRKLLLYILMSLFVILLIGGFFVQSYLIDHYLLSAIDTTSFEETVEYKVLPCENTKLLNLTEKEQYRYIKEEFLKQDWNVCYNPSCFDLCRDYCNHKQQSIFVHTMLRGDNPSCICSCSE
ncbi:MAG: hypothetical protein U9Q92_00230 [archaeon]|nr:hypothetical protein [archaeon]